MRRRAEGTTMILKATTEQIQNDYPTSDGKPMAETDIHRDLMLELIETLKWWYRDQSSVYVSGNLLVFYEKGNKRRHVSPDVFVVRGVANHMRDNYLLWEERPVDVAIELTSKSTKKEDIDKKYHLYRDVLGVKEYFLFDPKEDYLEPSSQGFRKVRDEFQPIKSIAGRLPSKVLGLHLERVGQYLRLRDPATGELVPTPAERAAAEAERADVAEAEVERLRRENAMLRGRNGK
jgi:Uma2 family endonuclease